MVAQSVKGPTLGTQGCEFKPQVGFCTGHEAYLTEQKTKTHKKLNSKLFVKEFYFVAKWETVRANPLPTGASVDTRLTQQAKAGTDPTAVRRFQNSHMRKHGPLGPPVRHRL